MLWNTQQLAVVTADAVVVAIIVVVECCHWLLLNVSDVKNCVTQIAYKSVYKYVAALLQCGVKRDAEFYVHILFFFIVNIYPK